MELNVNQANKKNNILSRILFVENKFILSMIIFYE